MMAESEGGSHNLSGLPKSERLSNKKSIEELFKNGSFFVTGHLRTINLKSPFEGDFPQVLFSVPKRNFKKAVHRNRIKRLMREAYRMEKSLIFTDYPLGNPFPKFVAFIYTGKEIPSQISLTKLVVQSLKKLISQKL